MGILQKLMQKHYQTLIVWWAAFRARRSAYLGAAEALKIPEAHYSLTLQEFCRQNALNYSYLKTSKGLHYTTTNELSEPSSKPLMSWGMIANGKLLTAQITQYRTTETGLLLSDILEDQVDPKYFLSAEQQAKITNNGLTDSIADQVIAHLNGEPYAKLDIQA